MQKYWDINTEAILSSIGELISADSLSHIPLAIRPHALQGVNSLIFTVDIKHPYRLLFVPIWEYDNSNPITTIKEVEIVELSINTHDNKFNASNYI